MTKTTNYRGSDGSEATDFDSLTAALIEVAEWEVNGATIRDNNGAVLATWNGKTETFDGPNGCVDLWEDICAEREAEDAAEYRFWNQDSSHRRFARAMGY